MTGGGMGDMPDHARRMRQKRMKPYMLLAAAAAFFPVMSSVAVAGPIERACMASDRGGNRSLCGCIQQAADMTLSGGDQRRAAGTCPVPVCRA